MNNKPLKGLDWFSFTFDLNKLRHLSIFQAIAYTMRNETDLILLGDEYERLIHKLEIDSADDVFKEYGETTDQYAAKKLVNLTSQEEYCIPESEVKKDLTLLNNNRFVLTVSMEAPISTLYTLLQSEINRFESKGNTTLKIIPKTIEGFECFYFKRTDLKNWKSLSMVKELGLLDASLNRTKTSSYLNLEKHQKYIGMLIHLLAHQSLYVDKGNVKFIKSSDVKNINYHKIYEFFNDNFLNEDKSVERDFPRKRTVDNDLKAAYEFFIDNVRLK